MAPVIEGNVFKELVWRRWPCTQRVLAVTDGSLDFGTGGFGLSEWVRVVQAAGHSVTSFHRSSFSFATTSPAVTLAHYDQLWLFGFEAGALPEREAKVIAAFMADGGGVFATGDHGVLGQAMGSVLPRVRSMRNWATVAMDTPLRLDTVIDPGPDGHKQFSDQSDEIAQRIYPVYFSNGGSDFSLGTWYPHAVLRHVSGAVDASPDHPHESECFQPAPAPGSVMLDGTAFEEWPERPTGGRPGAQIVAYAMSGGRFVESGAPTATGTKPPVLPRSFGAVSVYDGDSAGAGRIVCDATWHHFVNVNLLGTGTGRPGLHVGGSPTPEYLKIQAYYRNTVEWLAPRSRRWCWPWLRLVLARYDFDVLEELHPIPHPCPWDPMVRLGAMVEAVLVRDEGPGAGEDVVAELLAASGAPESLLALAGSRHPDDDRKGGHRGFEPLVPRQGLRHAVLGGVVNELLHVLPTDRDELEKLVRHDHHDLAGTTILDGVRAAERATADWLTGGIEATQKLVAELAR